MHPILGSLCVRQWEYRGKYVTVSPQGAHYLEMDTENSAGIRIQSDGWYDRVVGEEDLQNRCPTQEGTGNPSGSHNR